jgi:hypothetical protein
MDAFLTRIVRILSPLPLMLLKRKERGVTDLLQDAFDVVVHYPCHDRKEENND